MIAIRCRESGRSFRRSGVEFSGNAWTILDEATPEQLSERMLECIEVEDENDPRLAPPVAPEPEPEAEAVSIEEISSNDLAAAEAHIARLLQAGAEQQAEIERLTVENEALHQQLEDAEEALRQSNTKALAAEASSEAPQATETPTKEAETAEVTAGKKAKAQVAA